jgi:uncharacterized protein YqgC (DUF456 family)
LTDLSKAATVTGIVVVLIILGFILLVLGIVGCVLPVIPGPPLAYLSLILMSIARRWQAFPPAVLIVLGVLAVAVTVLDNVLPILTSKRKGASKAGIWGSVIGMIAGMMFFPPFGMILGTFAGAIVGELAFNRHKENALKAAWGVFVGTLLGIGLKLGVSGAIAFFFVRGLLEPPPLG